ALSPDVAVLSLPPAEPRQSASDVRPNGCSEANRPAPFSERRPLSERPRTRRQVSAEDCSREVVTLSRIAFVLPRPASLVPPGFSLSRKSLSDASYCPDLFAFRVSQDIPASRGASF